MKLSDFDYTLPRGLIAQYPLAQRDTSRLLILNRKSGQIQHGIFTDIIGYFKKGDVLVLNDTRVLPARLIGKKATGGKVDCLLLEQKSNRDFSVLLRPTDIKLGTKIYFDNESLKATVTDKKILHFETADTDYIYNKGIIPLPPYIKRLPRAVDQRRYQTVFAKRPGAVAAPTAGLHFTKKLISAIRKKGIDIVYVTLHINYATFNPVRQDDIAKHKMYKEYYQVNKDEFHFIKRAKESGKRIICVGTTSVRVLETVAELHLEDKENNSLYKGYTDLFIYPGYKFKITDCLLTNFHLPRTTLLMLVVAFAGRDNIMRVYNEAIREKYRFYSYGDAMLIL